MAIGGFDSVQKAITHFNVGYFWMAFNCVTSAAFVSCPWLIDQQTLIAVQVLTMRKRIKVTGFSDWDTMFYNNFLSIPVLAVFSLVVENWSRQNLELNL